MTTGTGGVGSAARRASRTSCAVRRTKVVSVWFCECTIAIDVKAE